MQIMGSILLSGLLVYLSVLIVLSFPMSTCYISFVLVNGKQKRSEDCGDSTVKRYEAQIEPNQDQGNKRELIHSFYFLSKISTM